MDEGLDYTYEPPEDVYQPKETNEAPTPSYEVFQTYLRHLELQQMPIEAYEYWVNTWVDQKPIEEETAEE